MGEGVYVAQKSGSNPLFVFNWEGGGNGGAYCSFCSFYCFFTAVAVVSKFIYSTVH